MADKEKLGVIFVEIRADATGLQKDIKKLKAQLEKDGKNTGSSFGASFKKAFGTLGIGLSVAGLFMAIKNLTQASIKQARAEAGVEQAVKRTGQAAGFTSTQLNKMASDLQTLTGMADEDILVGVTKQLLTFTNITKSSFKRAQEAVLDLNAVINQGSASGLTSMSIMMGKALEDPIRGMNALRRNGVTFTKEQEKMIKGFMRQNNLMAAQSIILSEVEGKYGGQAKALAEASAGTMQFSASWSDLKEAAGAFFTPVLNDLMPKMTKAIKGWIVLMQDAGKEFKKMLSISSSEFLPHAMESLKGTSPEYREEEKERLKKVLQENKTAWMDYYQEIRSIQKNGDIQDGMKKLFLNPLYDKQKQVSLSSNTIRTQIKAIEEFDKKESERSNLLNQEWSRSDKTLGEIQERIETLTESLTDFEPGDSEFKKRMNEVKSLTKFVESLNKDTVEETKNIQKQLYDELTFLAADYDSYRKKLIDEQVKKFKEAGIKEVEIQKYVNSKLGELEEEKKKFFNPENINMGDTFFEMLRDFESAKADMLDSSIDEDALSEENSRLNESIKTLEDLRLKAIDNEFARRRAAIEAEYDDILIRFGENNQIMKEAEQVKINELAVLQRDKYSQAFNEIQNIGQQIQSSFNIAGDTFLGKLMQALSVAQSIASVISSISTISSIFSTISSVASAPTLGLSSLLSFIPGKASGGSVVANKPYIVGDAPGGRLTPYSELFIPDRSGTIIPASMTRQIMERGTGMGGSENSVVTELRYIKGSIQALNINLMKKKFEATVPVFIDKKALSNAVTAEQNNYNKTGRKASEVR